MPVDIEEINDKMTLMQVNFPYRNFCVIAIKIVSVRGISEKYEDDFKQEYALAEVRLRMVSGDEAACVKARAFLGDIECAVVKYGVGRNNARLVDLDEALNRIRTAARNSLKLIGKIKPYKPLMPLEIKLELYRSDMCDEIDKRCENVERLDARTVRKIVHKISSYYDILFV